MSILGSRIRPSAVAIAFAWSTVILVLGYAAFGAWVTAIFSSSFLGGFVVWLCRPSQVTYADLKVPYLACLLLFVLHWVDEKAAGFFGALSGLTGVETPEIFSVPVVLLVLSSGGGWLLVLPLVKLGYQLGSYLAWTFFMAMGVTELAHFVFLFVAGGAYGYFPGMASVVLLAPAALWGMHRLYRPSAALRA